MLFFNRREKHMQQRIIDRNLLLICLICSFVVLSFCHATESAFLSHPISHSEYSQATLCNDPILVQNTTHSSRFLQFPFLLFLTERILFRILLFFKIFLPLFSMNTIIHIIRYIHKMDGKSRTHLFVSPVFYGLYGEK